MSKQAHITLNAIFPDIRLSTFSGQLGPNKGFDCAFVLFINDDLFTYNVC